MEVCGMAVRARATAGIVAFAMACALAGCSGSNDSPVGPGQTGGSNTPGGTVTPTGGSCRTLATASTGTTITGTVTSQTTTNCSFHSDTNQIVCTIQASDTTGASSTTTQTSTYPSRASLVDEITVIPPLQHVLSVVSSATGTSGSSSSTLNYTYDGQGRLTATDLVELGYVTTFTSWDASGRPLAGSAGSNTVTYSYDDAQRSMTSVNTASGLQPLTCVLRYDTNGNPTSQTCSSGGDSVTTTYVTTATTQVCK
jgi:hypothetical protein